MARQTTSRRTTNAMLAIQLHIQRIKRVTAGTNCNSNAIRVFGHILHARRCLVLGFVQLEADLGEIVELGNGGAFDLGGDAAFEDAVQQSVDVRFFGEVDE